MKITEKLKRAKGGPILLGTHVILKRQPLITTNSPSQSFEFNRPRTERGAINLFDRMERMYNLGPEFIDVTWGAGGSSSEATIETVTTAQVAIGLETCMHLTCTNMPKEKIDSALKQCKDVGIMNILALRGDAPHGQTTWTATEGGFANAIDLVRYIREQYGDYFCIGVAGNPEGHIENPNKEQDFQYFLEKAAIADFCITQLFYDPTIYLEWVAKVRAAGCTIPITPGIMPIRSYSGFHRMIGREKIYVPPNILTDLETVKDDEEAVKEYGIKQGIDMCDVLRQAGVKGFHFYTMNLEKSVRSIVEGLGFTPSLESVKPLPWKPSLSKKRKLESVRPIFWRNRNRSYILRTEGWSDFPNGQWGESRSPTYGEIDRYGVHLKCTPEEALKIWGSPTSLPEIYKLFSDFCNGTISSLPWCDEMAPESREIQTVLSGINLEGFLTINSQPAVDGAPSSDPQYGWGAKQGFVYQKSYVEFFVQPSVMDKLIKKLSENPHITYYAVNKKGDLKTNVRTDGPNAVTWGVFPGQEIVQPTVVDGASFMAWKDEAFELWFQWAEVYPVESDSSKLIKDITENWYLMNVVNNNFKDRKGIFEIFDCSQMG
ncbi:UNVERIFIED_CONTAM: hypothetical protein HDU68_008497 [Siphonaria sp. JEL0065]|nr:hypothetical protein HDU68_008497 [Siphonaria sp. JEL0065]